ncbi:hypothetical protein TcWFU_007694 [Taenia crassiceps]|uniref:Uncharacterized protein n=1 Tax=Taenia crassiceps TaxID=6207 RepID=A0ABR4QSJ1_9CEST
MLFIDALIGRFGANTGEGTPTATGWFEVEVSGVGLVFSKKPSKTGCDIWRRRKGHGTIILLKTIDIACPALAQL